MTPVRRTPSPATTADAVTDTPAVTASIDVHARRELGRIDRNIYGHFLEGNFFGNIHGGLFDEDVPRSHGPADSVPPVMHGLRKDVIDVCRELGLPVVRWPGGNYASAYHWEDGIGPRDERPRRLELTWGGDAGNPLREEDNRFGTDEFLAWCAAVGAEPYLNNSCRNVEEAARWVEYTNYGGDTANTRRRAANGHPAPYGVRYWGLGNEVYGAWQMGHRSAEQYAADAREHAVFMRRVDPSLKLIGVGWYAAQDGATIADRSADWTRALLERAGRLIDYVSIHLYGATTHLASIDGEYEAMVAQPLFFEESLRAYSGLVGTLSQQLGLDRPLALALDEWNMRHLEPASWPAPLPGELGGIAPRETAAVDAESPHTLRYRVNRWSPRTLADALFYAGVFQVLQRCSGLPVPVTMANTVNLLNANAPIVVRPGGVVKSATFHVWDLYQNHTGPIALPVTVEGPTDLRPVRRGAHTDGSGQFVTSPGNVAHLDAAATLSEDRRTLHLSVINRQRTDAIRARLTLDGGALPPRARVLQLGAEVDDCFAANELGVERVGLRDGGVVQLTGGDTAETVYCFPPHSLTLLSVKL